MKGETNEYGEYGWLDYNGTPVAAFSKTYSRYPPSHVQSGVQESKYCYERSILMSDKFLRTIRDYPYALVAKVQQLPHYPWSLIEVITLRVRQSRLVGAPELCFTLIILEELTFFDC